MSISNIRKCIAPHVSHGIASHMALRKRTRNIYDPSVVAPFRLSRSKIENFVKCPRCFYIDRRLGIGQPSMPGFTLNSAVDELLKKEFDTYRVAKQPHPLMVEHGVDAIPYTHPDLERWRDNFKGLEVLHAGTNLVICGAIDDLWVRPNGELIVVDYKSTSKDGEVTLDDQWKAAYKRQMEIYQWIARQMGHAVSDVGYFVYANGRKNMSRFDAALQFHMQVIPYNGNADWVEPTIRAAHECLCNDMLPSPGEDCEYCAYRELIAPIEGG